MPAEHHFMTHANHNSTFIILSKAVLFCAINTGFLWLSLFVMSSIPGMPKNFLSSTIGPILVLSITYLFLKLDKKSFSSIGLKFESSTLKKFFTGILIGVGITSLFMLSIIYASGLKIQLIKNVSFLFLLVIALPTIALLAFMEEIVFRSYPFIILKNTAGTLPALIITSILFGAYHVVFGWGITGFFSTSIWGLAFGLTAVYSNGISMSTGFHFAGNLVQSALGLTGSSYGIWNIASKNGQHVNNFQNIQTTMIIAQLILLAVIVVCLKLVLKDKNFR